MQIEEIINVSPLDLKIGRSNMAVARSGDYILFGGGMKYNEEADIIESSNIVDIFKLESDGTFKKNVAALSVARSNLAAASVGNYVLFGGGYDVNNKSDVVDVFRLNEKGEFLRTAKLRLSTKRYDLAATAIGNYVLFSGGLENGDIASKAIDIFKLESDGTFTQTVSMLEVGRFQISAASVGNYACFGFGYMNNPNGSYAPTDYISVFELIDDRIVLKEDCRVRIARVNTAAAVVGNSVLFAGGTRKTNVVQAITFDKNTIITNEIGNLHDVIYQGMSGTSIGNYAFFYGGYDVNTYSRSNIVDIFKLEADGTFTKTTETSTYGVEYGSAIGIGGYVLCGGGLIEERSEETPPKYSKNVDVFKLKRQEGWQFAECSKLSPNQLSKARENLAAASVGNYVLFGGGSEDGDKASIASKVIDIFKLESDGTFTHTTDELSRARHDLAAASVGNYVLFGGGYGVLWNEVDIFKLKEDGTFERLPDDTLSLSEGRWGLAAATVGNYVLFGGGWRFDESQILDVPSDVVDIFKLNEDGTFTHTTDKLSEARGNLAAASVGNYVLFGGGSDAVDIFKLNEDGTFTHTTDKLSKARHDLAAASVGNYVLFGGGLNSDGCSDTVDIFHLEADGTTFTHTTDKLSVARRYLTAASVENYVLFCGGNTGVDHSAVVDIFKFSGTVRKMTNTLRQSRTSPVGASVQNFLLFAGGEYYNSSTKLNERSDMVDIFKLVGSETKVSVPGIKQSDCAVYDIMLSDDGKTAMKELQEYEKISYVEPLNDAIEVTCLEETPSIDLKIQLKV